MIATVVSIKQSAMTNGRSGQITQAVLKLARPIGPQQIQQMVAMWLTPDGSAGLQEQRQYNFVGEVQRIRDHIVLMNPTFTAAAAPKAAQRERRWGGRQLVKFAGAAVMACLLIGSAVGWYLTSAKSATPAVAPLAAAKEPAKKPPAKAPANAPQVAGTTTAATGAAATTFSDFDPNDAVAACKDGTYAHDVQPADACAKHGGVATPSH